MCCYYLLKKLGSRDRFDPLPLLLISLNAALYAANIILCITVEQSGIIARFICRDRRKI
jgi:hypothetical protein